MTEYHMKSPRTVWLLLIERFFGVIVLFLLWPTLLLACLLIRATSDGPVVLVVEWPASDGNVAYSYRLRTTGAGSPAFHALGRFFRRYSIDKLPVFWSLARGDIRLRDALNWLKHR